MEQGTYAIDGMIDRHVWNTIDMVQHRGRDGELHLYSSKPPLLPTLLAGEYWLVHRLTGATLGSHPYEVGRFMLVTINVLPLMWMYLIIARLAERFGNSDWGRLYVVTAATFGTLLTTFSVVLNNHIVAAVSAAVALDAVVRICCDGERRRRWFVVAGLAAAFTAANELPALSFLVLIGLGLVWKAPRETITAFLPAALLVVIAFFATNYIAHDDLRPPYAHRSATNPDDNWYHFTYELRGRERESYWSNPKGIDRGEESRARYALHSLIGHHGIFSLTPVWVLSVLGICVWIISGNTQRRNIALAVALLTITCLVFFIGMRPQQDRNYGGMTSGFRWMMWFTPLWLLVMLPAVDWLAKCRLGMALALVLLAFSVVSVCYPTWNPWTHPWIYQWLEHCGWVAGY